MLTSNSWSQYWLEGHKTSFGESFIDCYDGIIKTEWDKVFKQLQSTMSVLDLCTGNASLLRLAKQSMSNFDQVLFTGVDYADIKIDDCFSTLENVKLQFNVNIEKLPFEAKSFDYVISNFGVEYSSLSESLKEVGRVLKVGGVIQFICHHTESNLIKSSQKELEFLNEIHTDNGAVFCLEKLVLALDEENKCSDALNSEYWRLALNKSLQKVADRHSLTLQQSDFLSFLKYILKPSVKEKLNMLDRFKKDMLSYVKNRGSMPPPAAPVAVPSGAGNFPHAIAPVNVTYDESRVTLEKMSDLLTS